MHDDDPRLLAAEAGVSLTTGAIAAFGGLDTIHVCALVVLAALYVSGLAIRLRLRTLARRARDDESDE